MSRRPRWARNLGAKLLIGGVLAFLFAPVLVVVAFSFDSSARLALPFDRLSLRWYRQTLQDADAMHALARSGIAAAATAAAATAIGVCAALALARVSERWRAIALAAAAAPIVVPALMIAFGLAVLYHQLGVEQSLLLTVSGHVLLALPFVLLTVSAALERFRFSMLEAARDLGASPPRAFRLIVLPIVRPAIEGAALLSMAISLDEFLVAFFTAGPDTTLPMLIWGRVRQGVDPSLNALASLLLVATTALAVLAARRTRPRW
jgi:spermidine/putrescine transport system permease protein